MSVSISGNRRPIDLASFLSWFLVTAVATLALGIVASSASADSSLSNVAAGRSVALAALACGGGELTQEAEAGKLSGSLSIVASDDASGQQFVQATVGTHGRTFPNDDYAEYCVTVTTPGVYRLDATVWAPNSSDDSFYVTADDGLPVLWDISNAVGFSTDAVSSRGDADPVTWNLAAGDHTFRFYHREDGTGIDSFELVSLTPAPAVCAGLVQEAEAGALAGSMSIVTETAASGERFVQATMRSGGRTFPNNDYAEYCVIVPTEGSYQLDATIWAPNSSDDSFYVTIGNSDDVLWDMKTSAGFGIDRVSDRGVSGPAIWNLAAGAHTLRFHQREDGAGIDRFALIEADRPGGPLPNVLPARQPPTATPEPTATAFAVPTSTPAPLHGVVLFEGVEQTGASHHLAPGVYADLADFPEIKNDTASSFVASRGYLVLLCSNSHGSGTCRTLSGTKNDLADHGLDDSVSYVQVQRTRDPFYLAPGNDVKEIVNHMPPGSTFIFTPGLYKGQAIIAKGAMTFLGQDGAILDGGGVATNAFTGTRAGVTISNLEIRGYQPGINAGAISARNLSDFSKQGLNWTVQNNWIHDNGGAGINVASGMQILGNEINNNRQIGVSGIGTSATPISNVIIDGNDIHNNGHDPYLRYPHNWHQGGMKFTHAAGLTIRNNAIVDNNLGGIYCDLHCDDVLIEDNTVIANDTTRLAVFYEWSDDVVIRGNTITGTGDYDGWRILLTVAEARNVLVENNTIYAQASNWTEYTHALTYRHCCNRAIVPSDIVFRNNTVHSYGIVRIGQSQGPEMERVTYENNEYIRHGRGFFQFRQENENLAWDEWQTVGQDLASTFE